MAYNEKLTEKVRAALAGVDNVEEKKMFRGVVFVVNDKMCITAGDNEVMFRIEPTLTEEALQQPGTRPVVMKGRDYKGYIYVHEDMLKTKKSFDHWLKLALEFNKKAKAGKKK